MRTFEVSGTYGGSRTPCTVYCYETRRGTWYAVEGSRNVNLTHEELSDGVDVEMLDDVDHFTAGRDIEDTDDLEEEVDS